VKEAFEIGGHNCLIVFRGVLKKGLDAEDAGVGDKMVDGAKAGDGRFNDGLCGSALLMSPSTRARVADAEKGARLVSRAVATTA
jgi:hypothetical protein